jgi:hypothetical protein
MKTKYLNKIRNKNSYGNISIYFLFITAGKTGELLSDCFPAELQNIRNTKRKSYGEGEL